MDGWLAAGAIFGGVALCAAFILVAAFFGDWLRYSGFWPTFILAFASLEVAAVPVAVAHIRKAFDAADADGVVLAIDSDGVYLGGRPSTVIEWRGIEQIQRVEHREDIGNDESTWEPYLVVTGTGVTLRRRWPGAGLPVRSHRASIDLIRAAAERYAPHVVVRDIGRVTGDQARLESR